MSDEAKVLALLSPLQKKPADLEGTDFKVDRERVSAAILRAAQQPPFAARAGWRSRAWLFAAVAACLLLGAGAVVRERTLVATPQKPQPAGPELPWVVSSLHGSVTRHDSGSEQPLKAARLVPAGELTSGLGSGARLRRSDGLQIELLEQSRVDVSGLRASADSASIQLIAGAVRCRLPGPGPASGFTVVALGVGVLARSAVFSVSIDDAGSGKTSCVRVDEGQVTLDGAGGRRRIDAGGSWGCGSNQPNERQAGTEPKGESPKDMAPRAARADESAVARRISNGTLEQENRLFQAGLSRERNGDTKGAVAAFEELLQRYPRSPLVQDARRALGRVKPAPRTPP